MVKILLLLTCLIPAGLCYAVIGLDYLTVAVAVAGYVAYRFITVA